jgi:hypothetical protein
MKNEPSLTLSYLSQLMGEIKKTKVLIAITARAEVKDYLINNIPMVKMPESDLYYGRPNNFCGINLYVVDSQAEDIKYWYSNQAEELREYLKNNI